MSLALEDLVEAKLAGESIEVPAELRDEFDRAIAAHDAIQFALGESFASSNDGTEKRAPPALPEDYEILRELGHGGMGVVYLARQRSLGREIAVKVLRPGEATFGPLVKRFLEEARHLARLRHPNIVSIHEIGHAGDEPYFTMDFVAGEPLSTVLSRGSLPGVRAEELKSDPLAPTVGLTPTRSASECERSPTRSRADSAGRAKLSPSQALAILKQAAAGVQHAHEHGIIHRDLKPSNILVDADGHAYVTDFGLARDMTQRSDLTRSGEIMGTPAYMAPEQAKGQKDLIGEATDVHALGVILYEMLTGKLPYGGDAPAVVMTNLLTNEPRPPRQIDRRIPRDLETICLKAMAKEPEKRYVSVRAFLEDIRRFESGEPILARRPGIASRAVRLAKRHWKLGAAAAITACVLLAVAPRLFDKSAEELLRWGDEQLYAGEYATAMRVYARAYPKVTPDVRHKITQAILRCGRELKDPKALGDAVQGILQFDPDVSFEEFDFAVAEGFGKRLDPARMSADEKRRVLELGEKRLLLVLAGTHCKDSEKEEAEKQMGNLRRIQAVLKIAPDLVGALPDGDPDELLRRAADPEGFEWSRGTNAFAAGFALEQAGKHDSALAAYRQAYELMRVAFPTFAGRTGHIRSGRQIELDREMIECRLLRQVCQSIRRLDPNAPDTLRGGIRFRIIGIELPPEWVRYLAVDLYDENLKNPQVWPTHGGGFPTQLDQTVFVPVADGKYRLAVTESGSYGSSSGKPSLAIQKLPAGFEMDFDQLPSEVEIAGKVVEIVIPARAMAVVKLLEPAADALVDLRQAVFRWESVPGAASYIIDFWWREPIPGGVRGNPVHKFTTSVTNFSLGAIPKEDVTKLKALEKGRTAIWSIHAYDAKDRRVAASVGDHTFKVGEPLTE